MRRLFTNLAFDERRAIGQMFEVKVSTAKIAERLCRDRSTIAREIKRNW